MAGSVLEDLDKLDRQQRLWFRQPHGIAERTDDGEGVAGLVMGRGNLLNVRQISHVINAATMRTKAIADWFDITHIDGAPDRGIVAARR